MAPKVGLINQRLQPVPRTPNCVSSMADKNDAKHYIEPISYQGELETVKEHLLAAIQSQPNVKLIKQEPDYWYFTFQTPMLKFTDDVEFYFPADEKRVHMRSASRIGYSDWGTNRKRLESVRSAFASKGKA